MSDDRLLIHTLKQTDTSLGKVLTPALIQELATRGYTCIPQHVTNHLPKVTFDGMQQIHMDRHKRWNGDGPDKFTILERASEMAGEVGEAVNKTKKLRRHQLGYAGNYKTGEQTAEQLVSAVAYECGDVVITAFNLANMVGFSLFDGVQTAFNTKSDEMGFPEKL